MERVHRRGARAAVGPGREPRAPVCASSPKRSTSPTLAAQIQQVLAAHPGAKWIQWEPVHARQRARRRPAGPRPVRRAGLRLHEGRRRPLARRRLPGRREGAGRRATRASSPRGAGVDAEPDRLNRLYVVEPTPSVTGVERRSPGAAEGEPDRELRARDRRRGRRCRRRSPAAPPAGSRARTSTASPQDLRRAPRHVARRRRRGAAARGARARARDEPGARQHRRDGDLSADARDRARRTARGAARARVGHERRPRADAGHRRRVEPGLHRAGRSEVRRRDEQGADAVPLGPVPRRDRDALPLARAGGALPRGVERRAHRRRHRVDRAAADSADVRRQVGARNRRDALRPRPSATATTSCASTGPE